MVLTPAQEMGWQQQQQEQRKSEDDAGRTDMWSRTRTTTGIRNTR